MTSKLINFALFQLGWLACVLLGRGQYHWLGPLIVVVVVAYHLATSPTSAAERRLLMYALAIGAVWENVLTLGGVVVYPSGHLFGVLAPIWIVAMWALLATTLNLSLRWLHGRMGLALAFGAIGGPMAFLAGERLGAVTFPQPVFALAILSAGWGVLFMVLILLADRHDGFSSLFSQTRRVS